MKSNFKRFLGILLAMLMVVTMLPGAAMADDATDTPGGRFTVGGKEYILMDSITENGTKYYGILSTYEVYNSGNIGYGSNLSFTVDDTNSTSGALRLIPTVGAYLYGALNIGSGRHALSNITNTFFPTATFGGYLKNHEWVMNDAHKLVDGTTTVKASFVGELGIPSVSELQGVMADNTLTVTSANGYLQTRTMTSRYPYKPFMRGVNASGTESGEINILDYTTYAVTNAGGSFYFMAYVSEDFFKNVKIDTTATIGNDVKAVFAGLNTLDVENAGYTNKELAILGIKLYSSNEKTESVSGDKFTLGGKEYILVNSITENGTKYYGLLSTVELHTASNAAYQMMGLGAPTADSTATVKYFEPYVTSMYGSLNMGTKPFVLKDNTEFFFPSATFGSYLKDHEWVMNESFTFSDGSTVKAAFKSKIGMPSQTEYISIFAKNTLPISANNGYLVARTLINHGGSATNIRMLNIKAPSTTTDATYLKIVDGSYTHSTVGGSYYFMAYVSEDFFKTTEIDITTAGAGVLDVLRTDFTASDLTGWSAETLKALFGSYSGEGVGLVADKSVSGNNIVVNVQVHNNGDTTLSRGACLVVAAYSGDSLAKVRLITLDNDVAANTYTSDIPVTLTVTDADAVDTVKVMLWNRIRDVKPLCSVITVQ